ncbi:dynein axonemal assembly factor 8 isoform X1 [Micropterus dolomieu]|uniref:dynein axonemal assembly factor 8 isoform X1 n=1 Tax=Micropterus dolomieu TaxID=147949 RepID=UPI001E8E6698|nr:dynein axonemal assembly factor 8 isoform X1 [Micropterus dolomieu]
MDLNHSSCWDSILEKVKPHIPTIDFDSSSSENEEVLLTIYQRPAGLSLKVPEDFDSFSLDDDELEELLKPVAHTCWSEESCSQSAKFDDDEIVEGKSATQWGTHHSDAETDACERGIVELNRAKLDASVKPNVDNTKSDEVFPVLSFARLDQWDLDDVLQNLREDGLSLQQHVSVEPAKIQADGDKCTSQGNIMERLVAFCNSQASKSAPEPVKSPNHIRQKNEWNKSLERMAAELQLSHQDFPTVYIDLRCPDPSLKPPRTYPSLSSESKSPAKHNTHWETKKPNLKVHVGSWMGDREVTGKSMLLQKIREINRNGTKCPDKYTDPPNSVLGNEEEELKEKLPQPVVSTCSHESHHLWEDKQTSHVQFEDRNPKMESPPIAQQCTLKTPKQQSDKHRQHKQHHQILKQLGIHRPTKSVNRKQPAAEGTDVLYDFEASHQQSITTLPADIESKGCMLLIVDLSGPGMVGDRVHGRGKHLHPAGAKSHIYNTLVAWFLSLAGPDPRHDEDEVSAMVPFWVAGLQQKWTEEGLALHVLAVARHCYTPRKRDIDIHTPFYNHVRRFLSETSLTLIAHWLPHLNNLLDQQAYASPILPSSCLNSFISATSNKKVIDRTFSLSPGFFWQTVETQERVCKGRETTQELHTEVAVALWRKAFFVHPFKTHYTLQLVLDSGLDICGLRLLYPPQGFLSDIAGVVSVIQRTDETCQPVLALAVRGPHAHSVLKDITSSLSPLLPRKKALSPLHCRSQEPRLIYSPRLSSQVHRELCLWFSGRLKGGSAQIHNRPLNRVVPLDDSVGGSLFSLGGSPSFLCATTKADILLVVSPGVPPCCYGQVLSVCERRGFSLRGLQRLQLQSNGAAVLGLTNQQALVFCSPHTVTLDQKELELPSHCLVLLLRKENAMRHSVSLPAALMREFKAEKLLGCIHTRLDGVHTAEPSFCFHTVPYSSYLSHMFVRCMWAVPDPSSAILLHQKHSPSSDMEQVVILTLCGKDMSQGLSLLHRVLTEGPGGNEQHGGFELLGLKYLPALTQFQAQELSPYEVGEQQCHDSLDQLMSSPALVCSLRCLNALASLRKLLPHDYPANFGVLMSPTPEVAFRQASLFFFEHEMICDYSIHPPLKCLPDNSSAEDPQMLLTVCLFKPRTWNHSLAKIVRKLLLSDLTLVGLRVVTLDKSIATSLLPAEGDPSDLEAHVEYLCSGSSLALCLEGENAVRMLLDVLGQEDSSLRTTCYGMAHSYNGIYGSGSYQKAIQDVKRLFPEGLCCTETSTKRQEQVQILSMCSDPLASVERAQRCTLAPVDQDSLSPSMASGPNGGSLIHSALWQTTCLLIPLNAPQMLSQVPSQLDMLEPLLRSGCHLVAGRMSILDNEQRNHIADTLKISQRNERMAHLYMAPCVCLIMALQGEAIVASFNLILESIYKENSALEKVGKRIIHPDSEEEAKQLICYLFDALSPESCHTIVP